MNISIQRWNLVARVVMIAALLVVAGGVSDAYGEDGEAQGGAAGDAAGGAADSALAGAPAGVDAALARGEALFEAHCEGCHGPQGMGTEAAPMIQGVVSGYGAHVVRAGRDEMPEHEGAMPAFDAEKVSDEALADIWAFVSAPSKPTDGEALFKRYCGSCHGPEGTGGRTGRHAAHEAEQGASKVLKWVRKGHGGARYADRREYMPAWDAAALSDAEVTLMADYLRAFASKGRDKKGK